MQQAQQRALAAAIGTNQRHALAGRNAQRDVAQRWHAALRVAKLHAGGVQYIQRRRHGATPSTTPNPRASGKSPLLVSSAMVVVMTRVKPSMLPPTSITAPTSEMARPKAASATVSRA